VTTQDQSGVSLTDATLYPESVKEFVQILRRLDHHAKAIVDLPGQVNSIDDAIVGLDVINKTIPVLRVTARHPTVDECFHGSAERSMIDVGVYPCYHAVIDEAIDSNAGRIGTEAYPFPEIAMRQSPVGLKRTDDLSVNFIYHSDIHCSTTH
jgi:hypothetical protein